jgi:hypothetical protein
MNRGPVQPSRTLRRELRLVREGLTLACLSIGVGSVPLDENVFVRALDQAWRRWPHAHKFPAVGRSSLGVGHLLWHEITRPGRRLSSTEHTYWRASADGARVQPFRTRTSPDLAEVLEELGPVSGHGWEGLAMTFLRGLDAPGAATRSGTDRSD